LELIDSDVRLGDMRPLSRLQIGTQANRQPRAAHPKFRVKRRVKILAVFAGVLLLLMVTGLAGAMSDRLMFYARVARLYTQEPESRIAMPLQDVTKRQIADTWGAPRGTGRRHEGQDIFAPKGTPILSATSGYVYKIGENNLGGQTVSVISKGGRVYYYAHLDSYAPGLEVGDRVSTRTVLGYVGTTGNAQGTPPHLHFGIYTFTGAINPLPLLTDRTAPKVTETTPRQNRTRNRLISRRV
jgi:murein DD-endopeptidase MepM/ murein hydrolase activator NlpD